MFFSKVEISFKNDNIWFSTDVTWCLSHRWISSRFNYNLIITQYKFAHWRCRLTQAETERCQKPAGSRYLLSDTIPRCFRRQHLVQRPPSGFHSCRRSSTCRCLCKRRSSACSECSPAGWQQGGVTRSNKSLEGEQKSFQGILAYQERSVCSYFLRVVGHHGAVIVNGLWTADQQWQQRHREQHADRVDVCT